MFNNAFTNAHITTAELERDNQMHIDINIFRIIREMTIFEARVKILNRQERYKKNYILRANKWSQIKHLQTRYNNTKHK